MERVPRGRYTREFREEAVKLLTVEGLSISEVSTRLSLSKTTLERWRRASRQGNLAEIGKDQRCLTELESELARVKKELALARMEREILKKAVAYFAKESLPGTR
jgi:transposase